MGSGEDLSLHPVKVPGYKEGLSYKAYKNADGVVCLKGSDGFEDMCYMLVSGFVEVKSS